MNSRPRPATESYSPINASTVVRRHHLTPIILFTSVSLLVIASVKVSLQVLNKEKQHTTEPTITKIAFIGNSILYFNDSPRFLPNLASAASSSHVIVQDSCLHGGESLISIFHKGNGMQEKFHSPNALRADGTYDIGSPTVTSLLMEQAWDFLVMNDYTQQPARKPQRQETISFLQQNYFPLLQNGSVVPVFLMTAAYREPVKGSQDLWPVEKFTTMLCEGYRAYAQALDKSLGLQNFSRIAPVGKAYFAIYNENRTLWEKLFYIDSLHPTVYGTFLQGCVLYWTIFDEAPDLAIHSPSDLEILWWNARRMYNPEDDVSVEFPSTDEAKKLLEIAERAWREGMNVC